MGQVDVRQNAVTATEGPTRIMDPLMIALITLLDRIDDLYDDMHSHTLWNDGVQIEMPQEKEIKLCRQAGLALCLLTWPGKDVGEAGILFNPYRRIGERKRFYAFLQWRKNGARTLDFSFAIDPRYASGMQYEVWTGPDGPA